MLRSVLGKSLAVAAASSFILDRDRKVSPFVTTARCESSSTQNPDIVIISGTTSVILSQKVCTELQRPLSNVAISQFSDGETFVNIQESMRGKDVFVIQTCAPPVNDNIMELLLSIAAAKRSGASSVTAVIPYFGYRLNRRGLPLSTTHHSRFLWNAAGDLAKMLLVVGADKVISVDLQKPGQGHEACFFKTQLPAETISTHDLFVQYFQQNLTGDAPIVVVAPNTEMVKKAKKFQRKLKSFRPEWTVDTAAFLRTDAESVNVTNLLGDVKGKDVVLIEDYIGKDFQRDLKLIIEMDVLLFNGRFCTTYHSTV
jgi:ribose-phosphate pyrophosphokinase